MAPFAGCIGNSAAAHCQVEGSSGANHGSALDIRGGRVFSFASLRSMYSQEFMRSRCAASWARSVLCRICNRQIGERDEHREPTDELPEIRELNEAHAEDPLPGADRLRRPAECPISATGCYQRSIAANRPSLRKPG